jgi:hypothetical protein
MMPAADVLIVEQSTVDWLHRHIDAISKIKRSIGPWPQRSPVVALDVSGVYAVSDDGTSWIVALSTELGPLALVVWAMRIGQGRKPLIRRELIGEVVPTRRDGPPSPLALFWRNELDPNGTLMSDDFAFIEAHEMGEEARVTAALELLRALVGRGLFAP